jgi:hypothetical protein
MAWRKPSGYKLVPADDALELTGLSEAELILQRDTQRLVRIDENGVRREFFRVPIDLLRSGEEEST